MKLFLVVALYGLLQAAFIGIASAGVIGLSGITPSKHAAKVVKEVMHDQKAEHGHSQHTHEPQAALSAAAVSGVVVAHQYSGGAKVDAGGEVVADMSFDPGRCSVIFPGRRHS